jgi:hypothetical protein
MFRWITRLLPWLFETVTETTPPSSMTGRTVVSFREAWAGIRMLAVSVPGRGGSGYHAFHHVDVDPSTGIATWGPIFEDTAYPGSPGFVDPLLEPGQVRVLFSGYGSDRARVYVAGDGVTAISGRDSASRG